MTVDRELTRLLTVSPSPEFVARVRQRVALEPLLRRRVRGKTILAVAAAVACALGLTLVRAPRERTGALSAGSRETGALGAAPVAASAVPLISAPSARLENPGASVAIGRAAARSDVVPVPAMTYREIEPQRGQWPVAEMQVHPIAPIVPVGGERPWSTL